MKLWQCISTEVASKCFKSLNMCQCWNIPVVWMTLSTKNVASLPVQPVSDFYGDVRLENRCTGKALKTVTHYEKQLFPFSCEVMGSNTKQIFIASLPIYKQMTNDDYTTQAALSKRTFNLAITTTVCVLSQLRSGNTYWKNVEVLNNSAYPGLNILIILSNFTMSRGL